MVLMGTIIHIISCLQDAVSIASPQMLGRSEVHSRHSINVPDRNPQALKMKVIKSHFSTSDSPDKKLKQAAIQEPEIVHTLEQEVLNEKYLHSIHYIFIF